MYLFKNRSLKLKKKRGVVIKVNQPQKNSTCVKNSTIYIVSFLILTAVVLHFTITKQALYPIILFGHKTKSILDLWSAQHLIVGILIGSILINLPTTSKLNATKTALIIISMVFSWEIIELIMESGQLGESIANWKAGYEH